MLAAGTLLQNRYRIERLVGQGGMGAVYLALDSTLAGKKVAIKEMVIAIEDADMRARATEQFRKEAEILAMLEHPGLVAVTHYFQEGNAQYLVMALVDGVNLEDRMNQSAEPLPLADIVRYAVSLGDILDYLHRHVPPVIVRDLKPANVMLDATGAIRLIDFGIARIATPDTKTGTYIRGALTPGFAPPEQYGADASTDARSDVYAFGATLYCLLTRSLPPEAVKRVTGATLAPIEPAAVNAVVAKMMALVPDYRYASAGEAAAALRAAANPTPVDCDVFVSYASQDRTRVHQILQAVEKAGLKPWVDHQQIAGGGNYGPDIVAAIRGAKVLMLMCSRTSMSSRNVKQEIQLAWKYGVPYLPLLLEKVSVPEELQYWLEGVQWIEVLDRSTDAWLPEVVEGIRKAQGSTVRPPPPQPKRNPAWAIGATVAMAGIAMVALWRPTDPPHQTPSPSPVVAVVPQPSPTPTSTPSQTPSQYDVTFKVEPQHLSLSIDGKTQGSEVSSGDSVTVAAGIHTFEFKRDGYKSTRQTVSIEQSGQTVVADLKSALGSLDIRTTPSGAQAMVDGRWVGATPVRLDGIRPQSYQIKLQMEGYETTELEATVQSGDDPTEVDRTLTPLAVAVQPDYPQGVAARVGVLDRYDAWKAAWSERRIDRYMACYSSDVKEKRQGQAPYGYDDLRARMQKAWSNLTYIRIEDEADPEIDIQGPVATLTVNQRYYSDHWHDEGPKTLVWRWSDGQWRIVEESFVQREGGAN